jgi:hypothetical protein
VRTITVIATRTLLPAALLFALGAYAAADELTDAAQGLCETVRTCVLEQAAQQDLTPEAREMMGPMLDNMCATMRSQVGEVPVGDGLYGPAVACLRSMHSLSCKEMQNPDRVATVQCKEYERLAREAGAASK